jgi:lipoprotein-anchoring transpeptidase ErfK/SrfK
MKRRISTRTVQLTYTFIIAGLLVPGIAEAQRRRAPAAPGNDPHALAVQVALDRAGFSPGEIDGQGGGKTRLALSAFQAANNLPASGTADEATLTALHVAPEPTTSYTITQHDVAGPFIGSMPKDMMAGAKLPAFGYTTPLEALAEKFHSSQTFLRRLNPGASWKPGEVIKVPDVDPFELPGKTQAKPAAARGTASKPSAAAPAKEAAALVEVVLNGATKSLVVRDSGGQVLMHAPMTSGSEHDPLPIGEWKVTGVSWNPTFNYNPDLFWDANPAHSKAKIAPGPNNPVGVVWVDINKEHFGLHGTPEPSTIGRTESHGCVRLTNWDAARLAKLVGPGTKVTIQ